jgi:SAM-dependent methyltransferase
MNRKERRAQRHVAGHAAGASSAAHAPRTAGELLQQAQTHQARGEWGAAVAACKRLLAAQPDFVPAHEGLIAAYLAQGKRHLASGQAAALAAAAPQTLSQFALVAARLKALVPELATATMDASVQAERVPVAMLTDPFLRTVLESTVVRDAAFERWLTAFRASLLLDVAMPDKPVDAALLGFSASLARQCFLNEFVFSRSASETAALNALTARLAAAFASGQPVEPIALLAYAAYESLGAAPFAQASMERPWLPVLRDVIVQQVDEPREERALMAAIPRLTPIGDGVSAAVRAQYEENPYPRWVRLASPPAVPFALDDYLRLFFPAAPFRPVGATERLEVLVAGCGTGRHALELAQSFRDAKVLGVDLSLASLAAAQRRVPPHLAGKIEFAQADILAIGTIERRFDFISAGGVLHHMDDPLAGWRELLKLLKPDGVMQVGLYSRLARKEIIETRATVAAQGYRPVPDDIRRLRDDLRTGDEKRPFMALDDFFATSDCRDLLFHVHERQITIPEIKSFLAANGLNFIGFQFSPPQAHEHYRALFARQGWPLRDLDCWDRFERNEPQLFAGMYVFWVQKA